MAIRSGTDALEFLVGPFVFAHLSWDVIDVAAV